MSETKTLQHRIDGPDDAPCLVLGPALGTTWHMWDRQIPELTRHWRVFRFELPGHGGAPAHPTTAIDELAARLLAVLDALGIDRFGYAGCSIGGAIGAQLALDHPWRVASLALIASAPRYATPDSWRQRGVVVRTNGLDPIAGTTAERWFTPRFTAAQPAIAEWAVHMVRTTDPGCYAAACEALATFDIRDRLESIAAPTLVVAGAEDEVTPPADARALVAGIPDARLALIPGAAHLPPVEQPAGVTELLVHHFATGWRDAPASEPLAGRPATDIPAHIPPQRSAVAELTAGDPGERRADPYEAGMRIRREVLGDSHVDRATEAADAFTEDFQDFITRYSWGEIWSRSGLGRRERSIVTLTALVADGRLEELATHTRAALRNGLTPDEIREVLLHTAVYCGVPAANSAFTVAQRVIQEETMPRE